MKRIRPIDASGLMNLLEKELDMNGITDWGKGYMDAIHDAMEHVKFMPTLEQNEIKHGHWKLLDDCSNAGVYCSVCSKKVYKTDYANQKIKSKYCPYCGSKMEVPKHWNLTGSNYMGNSDSHFAYSLFASRKKKRLLHDDNEVRIEPLVFICRTCGEMRLILDPRILEEYKRAEDDETYGYD